MIQLKNNTLNTTPKTSDLNYEPVAKKSKLHEQNYDRELYIVLDDAKPLLENSIEVEDNLKFNKFRVMRRAIIKKFSKAKVVFIVAGTNETLAQFISNDITRTSSEKSSQKKIYEPFYKVLFIDHLVPKTYFEKLIENLYNNIDQRDPYKSLFYFGRPLWGS